MIAAPLTLGALSRLPVSEAPSSDAASPSSSLGGTSAGVSPLAADAAGARSSPSPLVCPTSRLVAVDNIAHFHAMGQSPGPRGHGMLTGHEPNDVPLSPEAAASSGDGLDNEFNSSLDDEVVGVTADGELLFRRRDGGRGSEPPAVRPTPRPHRQEGQEEIDRATQVRYLSLRRRDRENDLYCAYVHEELQLLVRAAEASWADGLQDRFNAMQPTCLR
jgi:hypothetical protein